MAYLLSFLLLLLLRLTATRQTSAPSPPPDQQPEQQQQLNHVVEALKLSGDFNSWINLISFIDASTLPRSFTLFIPDDAVLSHLPPSTTPLLFLDPLIFPYHIVPERLSFSDLLHFKPNSRIPTLLPNKSILVTSNSPSHFTLDDTRVTHPDLYFNAVVSVHGIGAILDYSIYGDRGTLAADPAPVSSHSTPPGLSAGEASGRRKSDAACLCTEFPILLSVACASFALKFNRNGLLG